MLRGVRRSTTRSPFNLLLGGVCSFVWQRQTTAEGRNCNSTSSFDLISLQPWRTIQSYVLLRLLLHPLWYVVAVRGISRLERRYRWLGRRLLLEDKRHNALLQTRRWCCHPRRSKSKSRNIRNYLNDLFNILQAISRHRPNCCVQGRFHFPSSVSEWVIYH